MLGWEVKTEYLKESLDSRELLGNSSDLLSVSMACCISKSIVVESYPLSKNFCFRDDAWIWKVSILVQFLLSLNSWLRGTDLSQDLWWQLSMGMKLLRTVGLKWVWNLNWWEQISISRSRKCTLVELYSRVREIPLLLLLRYVKKSSRDLGEPSHRRRVSSIYLAHKT